MAIIEEFFEGDAACDALKHFVEQWRATKRIRRIIFSINGNDVQLYVRAHEKAFDATQATNPDTPLELIEFDDAPVIIPPDPVDENGNPLP